MFILPSKNEPASISLLEAMGNSMPVICSDTCGTRFYLKKNFSKIFKSDSLNSLTNSIEEVTWGGNVRLSPIIGTNIGLTFYESLSNDSLINKRFLVFS